MVAGILNGIFVILDGNLELLDELVKILDHVFALFRGSITYTGTPNLVSAANKKFQADRMLFNTFDGSTP